MNVMIERTPEGQTLVQGGTLNKLIEKLTQPETPGKEERGEKKKAEYRGGGGRGNRRSEAEK